MADMARGETFKTEGYDLVAHAQVTEGGGPNGEVVVLNNNSTHYLVALRPGDGDEYASLVRSFRYFDSEESVFRAYRAALSLMIAEASRR